MYHYSAPQVMLVTSNFAVAFELYPYKFTTGIVHQLRDFTELANDPFVISINKIAISMT